MFNFWRTREIPTPHIEPLDEVKDCVDRSENRDCGEPPCADSDLQLVARPSRNHLKVLSP